jgi:hypothetical protein
MRAHTITTKGVGGRSRTKRTIVPGGIIALAAALLVWMVVPGTAAAHGTHQKAKMAGSKVIGQSGAPNGEGTAKLHLLPTSKPVDKAGLQRVCFTIKYSGIGSRKGLSIVVSRGKEDGNGLLLVREEKKPPIHDCGKKFGLHDAIPRSLLMEMTRSPRRFTSICRPTSSRTARFAAS